MQQLKEEEEQISQKLLSLRKDVSAHSEGGRTLKIMFWSFNDVCLHYQLVKALVPADPLDSSNILLEVVTGRTTGGTGCLFYNFLLEYTECFLVFFNIQLCF